MFKIFQRNRQAKATIAELREQNCTLTGELSEAQSDVKEWRRNHELIGEKRDSLQTQLDEANEANEVVSETLEQVNETNDQLRTENLKLREGASHALAAVQDVANAFVKRLDMLPPMCGLPEDLVNSVFFFKLNGFTPKDHWEIKFKFKDETITGINELGLFTIKIDFGKEVTAEAKLWVVPKV